MLAILFYCLKVLLYSGLLFGYYLWALRNKHFHAWNRYYLLLTVLLSFALPFVHIPFFYTTDNTNTDIILRSLQFGNYEDDIIIRPTNNWQINWNLIAIILYSFISGFFLFKLFKTFNWIKKIKSTYPSEMLEEIQFYNTAENGTPFSFFKNIFWHKDVEPSSSKGLQMLRHEIAHVRQLHSADKLLMEITTIIAWWNPFFYAIKKELSTIHEFIADEQATNGDDNLQYASLLLQSAFGNNNIALTNPFFHSQLKRRIAMLTTIKNPQFSYLRRLMVLPLAAGLFILMAFKFKEKKNNELKTPVPITVVIDAGHGGMDDGVTDENGLKEKDISLAIVVKIKSLAASRNINVILTRSSDELPGGATNINTGLKQRTSISSKSNADLFVSIHVNKNGFTDDYLPKTNSNGIMAFITKNNQNTLSKSRIFASALIDELEKSGLNVSKDIHQRKYNSVWVLDSNPLPAVVLELGFIDNPTDAAFISNPKNQEKLANEILDGIVKAAAGLKDKNNQPATNKQSVNTKILQGYLVDTPKIVNKKDNLMKKNNMEIVGDTPHYDFKIKEITVNGSPHISPGKDSAKRYLYIIDGIETPYNSLNTIQPNQIESISVFKDEKAVNLYGEKGRNGVILITTKSQKLPEITVIAYKSPVTDNGIAMPENKETDKINLDESAQFPGGTIGWSRYLERNLSYPKEAQTKNIQGAVRVQLTVNEDGTVQNVIALNNPGGGISEEAERIIKKGPNWIPAKQNGKPVASRFEQTIKFQLQ